MNLSQVDWKFIFCHRKKSDRPVDPSKVAHGTSGWFDCGSGEREEFFYDEPTKVFVSRDEFERLRKQRAQERAKMYPNRRRSEALHFYFVN